MTRVPPFLLLSLFQILLLSSCSRYVRYLEKKEDQKISYELPKEESPYCPLLKSDNIIHDSPFSLKEFQPLLDKANKLGLNTLEKGLILIFYQMMVRPDATDWSSRVQLHLKMKDKEIHREYGHFSSLPMAQAVASLKDQKLISRPLKFYLNFTYKHLPQKLTIQESLHLFIKEHQNTLINQKDIKERFFKLDKPLQKGESFKKMDLTIPRITTSTVSGQKTFPLSKDFNCSFDAQLYQKGIFLISKKPFRENAFGFISPNGDYFFTVTKKELSKSHSYDEQLFSGKSPTSISPFCTSKKDNLAVTLLGFKSRDPGQLLYHLYNYQIIEASNEREIIDYLKFPRHQFLTNPSRLLYESKRGSEEQLRYFLSLDFPVYHVNKLGVVYAIMTNGKKTTFIGDTRFRTYQSCQN